MAKTASPAAVAIPGAAEPFFVTNALPDPFDARDLEYRPVLERLDPYLDERTLASKSYVMEQKGQSCTGHAVATLINTVLSQPSRFLRSSSSANGSGTSASSPGDQPAAPASLLVDGPVSPYMLYRLARRYDEFAGEADEGSSLRAVLKGWFHHGVVPASAWEELMMDPEPDLENPELVKLALKYPLGAYYRVNAFRLDDMQSAIHELHAIVASAVIHDGWINPEPLQLGERQLRVIAPTDDPKRLGGHAFAIVGYNEVGFLVQNSWGTKWGKGGFATLPYEDWLDSAYDAWVARPGVPKLAFARERNLTARTSFGGFGAGKDEELQRLRMHVVNLGNQGRLSENGKFVSTPKSIDDAFGQMKVKHDKWQAKSPGTKRRIVLYAHGGLISEASGLGIAQKHLQWWLNNQVYPLTFAWQSGPSETLVDHLIDSLKDRIPFGILGFDLFEQVDRRVEQVARATATWMWTEMKENARAASAPLTEDAVWPPASTAAIQQMSGQPGATLTISRLAKYVLECGPENVEVHLVGHSAGSIFLAAMLARLADARVTVESLTYLAPAIRSNEFAVDVMPHLVSRLVKKFTTFAMNDKVELDDSLGAGPIKAYHKSLLYLVARALEKPGRADEREVPLVGMQRAFGRPVDGQGSATLAGELARVGATTVFSPSDAAPDQRSEARSHGAFDDDEETMTSVIMRILGVQDPQLVEAYRPNAPSRDTALEPAGAAAPAPSAAPEATTVPGSATRIAAQPPVPASAATEPGDASKPAAPATPDSTAVGLPVAPRTGRPILDKMHQAGWQSSASAPDPA